MRNIHKINQHTYITDDSEIKERDWFTDNNNSLKKSYKLSHVQFANPKKIILTTNDLLIKDGVQAIDDEFLEWFVKNPSCDEVKVIYELNINGKNGLDRARFVYKIIIPKEEQDNKLYSEEEKEQILSNFIKIGSGPAEITGFKVPDNYEKEFLNSLEKMKKEELKQETPEEVAQKFIDRYDIGSYNVLKHIDKDLYNDKVEISVLALIEIKRAFGALIKDENSYVHKVFMDDYVYEALRELKSTYAEYFDEQIKDW